jgi:hypothetical protein
MVARMDLTATNVQAVFFDCLFSDEAAATTPRTEMIERGVKAEGVNLRVCFDPEQLKAREADIHSLLDQLPPAFADGMTFLEMPLDAHGTHWAEHPTCDQLLALGLAIGRLAYCLPRELWSALPESLPYVQLRPRA